MGKYTVTSGIVNHAKKVVIYGVESVGKTSLASKFPHPVFIDTEGSTNQLDVNRLPKPTSWPMLIDEVKEVAQERLYQTLIIDTADWAEKLCTEHVCSIRGKKGVEDFGFGTGYTYVAEEWGRFLDLLQHVVDTANINVVLTAHATIRKFEQPDEMGAYDRYELKLGKKTTGQTAPITKEWADMVLFLNFKTVVVAKDDKGKKFQGQGGQRVMYTTRRPAWDAKNRFNLPDELPLDYKYISHIFENSNIQANSTYAPQNNVNVNVNPNVNVSANVNTVSIKNEQMPETLEEVRVPSEQEIENTPLMNELDGLPQSLKDLMISNKVHEDEIRNVVAMKGYYPVDTPVRNYDPEFINGVIIGAWGKVYQMIAENRSGIQF